MRRSAVSSQYIVLLWYIFVNLLTHRNVEELSLSVFLCAGKLLALESTSEVDCVRRVGPAKENRSDDEVELSRPQLAVAGPRQTTGKVLLSHWIIGALLSLDDIMVLVRQLSYAIKTYRERIN